jgi:hypothetical protein
MITQPNKLGSIPPGALELALNVYMRDPGYIQSALLWTGSISLSATSGRTDPPIWIIPIGRQALFLYKTSTIWRWAWTPLDSVSLSTAAFVNDEGEQQMLRDNGQVSWGTTLGHTLVNCQLGVMVFDYEDPSTTAQRTPRQAGLYPPQYLSFSQQSVVGSGALAANTHAHWTAIIRRRFPATSGANQNYELVSAPCIAVHTYGPVSDFEHVSFTVYIDPDFSKAGDIVELYRTRTQEFNYSGAAATWFVTNTGSDYYLAGSATVSTSGAGSVTIVDSTPDTSLGEALYTNDGLQGAESSALTPPTCADIVSFKGYTFYLSTIDAPFVKLRSPLIWGSLGLSSGSASNVRERGYGRLSFVGTRTSASNQITSVSATDMVGLAIGQEFTGAGFSSVGTITNLSGSTVTVSVTASSSAAGDSYLATDVIEIDGVRMAATNASVFALGVAFGDYFVSLLSRVSAPIFPNVSSVDTVPADFMFVTKKDFWGELVAAKTYMTARATRGHLLDPPLPRIELSETARSFYMTEHPNGFRWSEENQPENCPATNAAFCGSGTIYRGYATRDALWIFASDGLWRLSGTGGQSGRGYDWRVDPVDSTLILSGPHAGCVLRDTVYAYTNRGLVSVDSSGNVRELSHGRLNDVLPGPTWTLPTTYSASNAIFLLADEAADEIRMRESGASGGVTWIYNVMTDAFTQDMVSQSTSAPFHGAYSRYLEKPLISCASSSGVIRFPATSGSYGEVDLRFQPVFGGSSFDMHHWQIVEAVYDEQVAQLSCYLNDSSTPIGTRSAAAILDASSFHRVAFGVPRNAPAAANNIKVRLGIPVSGSRNRLQGVALTYKTLTEQRKVR